MARRRIRVAPAAQAILNQATYHRPKRSKRSDGTIGDRAHRARRSDHNPDFRGVVHAADLTHDPARGIDAHAWAIWLANKRDPRVKYIISNRKWWSPQHGWQKYTKQNPHTKHVHVSVEPSRENDTSPWFEGWLYHGNSTISPPVAKPLPMRSQISSGETGRLVEIAQWELAVAAGRQFPESSLGAYDLHLIAAVRDLGKILGKNWTGLFIGPDQWQAIDFLYLAKGHEPLVK